MDDVWLPEGHFHGSTSSQHHVSCISPLWQCQSEVPEHWIPYCWGGAIPGDLLILSKSPCSPGRGSPGCLGWVHTNKQGFGDRLSLNPSSATSYSVHALGQVTSTNLRLSLFIFKSGPRNSGCVDVPQCLRGNMHLVNGRSAVREGALIWTSLSWSWYCQDFSILVFFSVIWERL